MMILSQHPNRAAALLEQACQEQERCERLQEALAGLDSQAANNCWFDAGALSACQRILNTAQRGEDVLADIAALIALIAELNDARGSDAL
jgi:uncharacterized protein YfaA (DUF2138 family)